MKKYIKSFAIFFSLNFICQVAIGQNQFRDGSLAFSFDMYQKMRTADPNGNIFYAPMSISTAFSLAYAGASGLTKQQIESVFYFDDNPKKNLKIYKDYINDLEQEKDITLRIANGMWLDENMPVNSSFIKMTRQLTGKDEIHQVGFSKNYKASTSQINQWISEHTEGNIKDLIPSRSINELTRFVMANAIYFQGDWAAAFDNQLTATNSFYGLNDKIIETQFMTKAVMDHKFYENDEVQVLELPYKGESTSMVIVLPRFAGGLKKIENSLSAVTYQQWLKGMTKRPVVVTIPKFHMKNQYNMRSTFRKMGLKEPFTDASSFDEMTNESLRLSNVFHQAFIIVSEEGTEAAAATTVIGRSKGVLKLKPAFFNANQPFLFFIKDNETDMILFMGRMTEPENNGAVTYTTDVQPKRFPEIPTPQTDKIHWVEKGESLYGISKKYGITIEQIKLLNDLTDNIVQIGQELLIQEGEREEIPFIDDRNLVNFAKGMENRVHEVSPGESLFSISRKYHLSVDKLKALNGIEDNIIFIGQKLKVKGEQSLTNTPAKPKQETLPKLQPVEVTKKTYVVKKGDTLWKISHQFGVSIDTIKSKNGLASDILSIGQELRLN